MTHKTTLSAYEVGQSQSFIEIEPKTLLELRETTGQRLIDSTKEALAFARGEPNECVVHEPINTSEKCPVETIYGGGEQAELWG